jgi:hypothetical protein
MNEYGFLLEKHRPIRIESAKVTLIVIWGVTGFHVVKLLPKGDTFNASDYVNEIISEIASWREGQGGKTNRRLIAHIDNARTHIAGSALGYIKSCRIVRAHHFLYSPDLAPSDFFLFGYLKSMLQGRHFETGDNLLATIMELTGTVEKRLWRGFVSSGWKDWENVSVWMVNMPEEMNKRLRGWSVLAGRNRGANIWSDHHIIAHLKPNRKL